MRGAPALLALALAGGLSASALAQTTPADQARAAMAKAGGPPKVLIAGDSTAAEYGPDRYPQMGWGQVLACSLDGVPVVDLAKGGRSTKSFIAEDWFGELLKQTAPGDTVLIQFGHNDAAAGRPERFTEPDGDFRENLRAYVAAVRAKSAAPVLVTPVARRRWENGRVVDTLGPYAQVAREVAAQTRTPLIDLSRSSMALVQNLGEEPSKRYYLHYTAADGIARYPQGVTDDTHFSEIGARAMAGLVARGLRDTGLPVAARVRADVDASAPPSVRGGPACS